MNCCEIKEEIRELQKKIDELKSFINTKADYEDDPIFLLSIEEYKKYRSKIHNPHYWWWLQSPGNYSHSSDCSNCVCIIYDDSIFYHGNVVNDSNGAVCPAIKISKLKCDTEIAYNSARTHFFALGATWIKIDDDLAIAEMPIMFSRFDEESNDYETSEIRQKLLEWYKERITW